MSSRYAAKIGRPAGAIARIERVIDLPREVVDAEAIEPARVCSAEQLQAVALVLGKVRIEGISFRGKIVRTVRAHLMRIDECDRVPVLDNSNATLGLRLSSG